MISMPAGTQTLRFTAWRSIPSPSASAPKLSNFKARGEFALRFVRCKVSAYNGDIAIART
jgi:hypothetical protein